nr:nicotinate-nucleotide adenylyltransferase [bacterium]
MAEGWQGLHRIGLLGGTFNPVHLGHTALARAALEGLGLEGVVLMPTGDPPHKRHGLAPAACRLEMVRLACREQSGLYPSAMEVERPGTTFTVDTLRQIKSASPKLEVCFLIGGDTVWELPTWWRFDEIATLTRFAAAVRPGAGSLEELCREAERLHGRYGADISFLPFIGPDISSTAIRQAAAGGGDLAPLVGKKVASYIRQHGLYRE